MSQNQNGGDSSDGAGPRPSWGSKAGYIGTGILIGLVIYPFVRKALTTIQPKMDRIFDDLTGKAENLAEKTSDLLARAKESLRKAELREDDQGHSHGKKKT